LKVLGKYLIGLTGKRKNKRKKDNLCDRINHEKDKLAY